MNRVRAALALAAVIRAASEGAAAAEPPPPPADANPTVVVTPPPTSAEQAQAASDAARPPEPPNQPPPLVGFVKGQGFRFLSADENWRLRIGLQAAVGYNPTFVDPSTGSNIHNWNQFRLPFVRPRVDGSLLRKWIRYWFSFEFARFPPFLLDGYVEAQPLDLIGVRVGQMYTPISWHEYLGPQELIFPEWAVTADYFWTGRDKGVQVFGESPHVDYYAGFFAGSPLRTVDTVPGNYQLMARVTVKPLGALGWGEIPFIMADKAVPFRFHVTAQGYWSRVTPTTTGFNESNGLLIQRDLGERKLATASAELLIQWGRFWFYSEFYARRVESLTTPTAPFWQYGAWAQAHVTVWRRFLDLAVRFNWIDPDGSLSNDQYYQGEAQVAWFPAAPYLSLKLRYAIAHQQDPGPAPADNPMLLDVVGLPFTPGTGQLLTLQATVYF